MFKLNRFYEYLKMHRRSIGLAVIVLLAVYVCRKLLFTQGVPTGMDILGQVVFLDFFSHHNWWLYTWNPLYSFGEITVFRDETNPFYIPLSVISNAALAIRIYVFILILLAGVSMYFFTFHCTRRNNTSLLASLLFMISQWFFSQIFDGHVSLVAGYALAPALFLAFDKVLEKIELRNIVFASAVFSIFILVSHPHSKYIYGAFLVLFAFLFVLFPKKQGKLKALESLLKVCTLLAIITLFLLMYQILPLLLNVRPIYLSTTQDIEGAYIWSNKSLLSAIAAKATELSYSGQLEYPSSGIISLLWIPILAYSAIVLRRNRYTLFFTISAIICVFIAKGPYPPLGEVYVWLFTNVPGFGTIKVGSRWLMMAAFSYAFLAAVAVDEIYDHLKGDHSKFLRTIFITLTLVNVCLVSWTGLFYGPRTYTFPDVYVEPYKWIKEQPGDFNVLALPYGQLYMNTPWSGPSRDPRFYSPMIQGRSVITEGGTAFSQDFLSFIGSLIRNYGTDDLANILAAFNIKYFVIHPDISDNERIFFSSQGGLTTVYQYENATVMENDYDTSHVFAVSKYAIVVGGREAFTALTTVDTLDFSNWGLLFADQIVDQLGVDQLLELLKEAHLLIFINSEPLDLAMLTLEDAIRIRATYYAYPSTDASKHWVNEDKWTSMGMSVQNRYLLSTSGNLSVSMPINVEEEKQYDLWIRLLYAPDRGNLSITIDGTAIGSIVSHSTQYYSGLKWVKIGSIQLRQGRHELVLTNKWALGKCNNVDEILLVQPQHLESAINQLTTLLQTSPVRIINIIEGEQMFKWVTTPQSYAWWPTRWPLLFNVSGGYVASTVEETAWMPLTLFVPRNGTYGIAVRATTGPVNGTLDLMINEEHTRHIELTPMEIREINTTTIIDDDQKTFWKNQNPEQVTLINDEDNKISGNNSLKINVHTPGRTNWSLLEKTYDTMEDWNEDKYITFWFKGACSNATFSVYIYFDGSPDNYAAYNFVDTFTVWKHFIFQLSSPVATGGTIDWSKVWRIKFAIEDRNATGTFQIDRMARAHELEVEEAFDWVTLQPLALEAANNTIELYANNEVNLDQMVIYSLNPGEENATLEDIFKIDKTQTAISYKKIDPTKYIAHVKTDTPFLLMFSDAYHNLWKAYVNGEEIRSIPAYSFINAFYITETGEYDVTIEFIGQRYVVYGGIISIATIILITIYLAFNVRINRFIAKKFKLKKGNEK